MDDLPVINEESVQSSINISRTELLSIKELLKDLVNNDLIKKRTPGIMERIDISLYTIDKSLNIIEDKKEYVKLYLEIAHFKRKIDFLYKHQPVSISITTNILIEKDRCLLLIELLGMLLSSINNIVIFDDEQDNLLINYTKNDNSELDPNINIILFKLGGVLYMEENLFLIPCKNKPLNKNSILTKRILNDILSIDQNKKVIVIVDDSLVCARMLLNRINKLFFKDCNELKIQNDMITSLEWRNPNVIFLSKENYTFIIASNGQLGFDILSLIKPHLVITDIEMPEINGMEMINKLSSINIFHKTIISSTLSDETIYKELNNISNNNIVIARKGCSEEFIKNILIKYF